MNKYRIFRENATKGIQPQAFKSMEANTFGIRLHFGTESTELESESYGHGRRGLGISARAGAHCCRSGAGCKHLTGHVIDRGHSHVVHTIAQVGIGNDRTVKIQCRCINLTRWTTQQAQIQGARNVDACHSRVAGSEYHAIPGAPHNVYYEAAEPYNAIVDAFLAKVMAPVAAR